MKQVISKKRKFTYKDVLRWLGIFLLNYIVIAAYVFLLVWAHDFQEGIKFTFNITGQSWGLIYPLTIGPVVSSVAQIFYSERGSIGMRAAMWFHLLTMLLMVPIVIWFTM